MYYALFQKTNDDFHNKFIKNNMGNKGADQPDT